MSCCMDFQLDDDNMLDTTQASLRSAFSPLFQIDARVMRGVLSV